MKKVSLLLGTLGGALAGYILSNDKLRHELTNAKDAETAAKALGAHMAKDGKKIAKEVKTFAESDDVQKNFKKAKTFASDKFNEAQKKLQTMMAKSGKKATTAVKNQAKKVEKKMKVKQTNV